MNDIDADIASWQDAADADQAEANNPEHTPSDRERYAADAEYSRMRVRHLKDLKARQEAGS